MPVVCSSGVCAGKNETAGCEGVPLRVRIVESRRTSHAAWLFHWRMCAGKNENRDGKKETRGKCELMYPERFVAIGSIN